MDPIEKEALLYGFLDFSSMTGNSGPRELLKPVILKSINTIGSSKFTLEELRDAVVKDFGNKLDYLILRSEINKYMRQGIIKYDASERKYINLENVEQYAKDYSSSVDNNNYFITALKKFISDQTDLYDKLTFAEVFKYLIKYIESNFSEILSLVGKQKTLIQEMNDKEGIHRFIELFIYSKVVSEQRLFNAFENIFNGIVMLFLYMNCPRIFNGEDPFKQKQLFLDTNIVLRILGLQDDIANEMGSELVRYLKIPNIQTSITDETWLEICSLINGYPYDYSRLLRYGKVNHVYQTMKNNNIDPNLVGEYIDEIKSKLDDLSIYIDDLNAIKVEDYKKVDDHIQELARRKHDHKCEVDGNLTPFEEIDQSQYIRQSKHDIKNIYNIMYLRNGKRAKHFEDEKYFFITADYILRKYTRSKMNIGGQPLALSDSTLAFILYYKDQNVAKKFALNSFINAHFNSKRLSIRNWIEYYEVIKRKVEKGDLDKSQAGYLLSQVILDNDRFETSGIEDIIEESIEEYEKKKEEYQKTHEEKKSLEEENVNIYNRLLQNEGKVGILENEIVQLKNETREISTENQTLKNGLETQSKKTNIMRKQLLYLSFFLFAIGIYFTVFDTKIIGGVITIVSVIMFIYEMYQKYKK